MILKSNKKTHIVTSCHTFKGYIIIVKKFKENKLEKKWKKINW